MFSAILFSNNPAHCRTIENIAQESGQVCIYRTMHAFPSPHELSCLLKAFNPDIVFVDLGQREDALWLIRGIRGIRPHTATIGFAWSCEDWQAQHYARLTEVAVMLPSPLTGAMFRRALDVAVGQVRTGLNDNLLVFLPAKAGSGSSTIALHVAGCLANERHGSVLLIDADFRSGLIAELLKVSVQYSLVDALQNASSLDGTLWNAITVKADDLEVLASGRAEKARAFTWAEYRHLLDFALARYQSVVVDLPEAVDEATVEVVRRARNVFIVCTAELPSLLLTRRRQQELRNSGVPRERVKIILNRWNPRDVTLEDVEQFLEEPPAVVFQNDYQAIHGAIVEGRLLRPKSELGKSFAGFAHQIAGASPVATPLLFTPSAAMTIAAS
jgi:pilus assembly protein CpaE